MYFYRLLKCIYTKCPLKSLTIFPFGYLSHSAHLMVTVWGRGTLLFYGNWLRTSGIPYDRIWFLVWGAASGTVSSVQQYAVALVAFCVFCLESPHPLAWLHLPSNLHLSWSFLVDFFFPF